MKIFFGKIIFLALLLLSFQYSLAEDSKANIPVPLPSKEMLLKLQADDQSMGNKEAKVVLIEYSSLACPHCADFHKSILPEIKKNYIDNGLILYIHRDFATNKPSLVAAALAECSGNYFRFLNALFESQNIWAFHKDYEKSLLNIAKLAGMDEEKFKQCIQDEKELDKVYESTFNASKVLDIVGTPALLLNGNNLGHIASYEKIADKINQELGIQGK